jgi:hypothetical protein
MESGFLVVAVIVPGRQGRLQLGRSGTPGMFTVALEVNGVPSHD